MSAQKLCWWGNLTIEEFKFVIVSLIVSERQARRWDQDM